MSQIQNTRLPEETDKTSKFRQLLIVRLPKVANSLCVTEALIMSHCAVRVAFLPSVQDIEKKKKEFIGQQTDDYF